jgi:hypothetical protein
MCPQHKKGRKDGRERKHSVWAFMFLNPTIVLCPLLSGQLCSKGHCPLSLWPHLLLPSPLVPAAPVTLASWSSYKWFSALSHPQPASGPVCRLSIPCLESLYPILIKSSPYLLLMILYEQSQSPPLALKE